MIKDYLDGKIRGEDFCDYLNEIKLYKKKYEYGLVCGVTFEFCKHNYTNLSFNNCPVYGFVQQRIKDLKKNGRNIKNKIL